MSPSVSRMNLAAVLWSGALGLVAGSSANIYGVCNQYNSTAHFQNIQTSDDRCDAGPMGRCDRGHEYGMWIPPCESAIDFQYHHMHVWSDDGKVDWSFWKVDSASMIRGGPDFGRAVDMTRYPKSPQDGQWLVVIRPNATVQLFPAVDTADCPPLPPTTCEVGPGNVTGYWLYRFTIAAPIQETWKHGTTKTHTESTTEGWSSSVSVSVMAGFSFAGFTSSITVDTTVSHSMSQTYSDEWTMNEEETFTINFGEDLVGKAAWQFQFTEKDDCEHEERTFVQEFAVTQNRLQMPCCLPGYFANAGGKIDYTTCLLNTTMVPDGKKFGCKVLPQDGNILM